MLAAQRVDEAPSRVLPQRVCAPQSLCGRRSPQEGGHLVVDYLDHRLARLHRR